MLWVLGCPSQGPSDNPKGTEDCGRLASQPQMHWLMTPRGPWLCGVEWPLKLVRAPGLCVALRTWVASKAAAFSKQVSLQTSSSSLSNDARIAHARLSFQGRGCPHSHDKWIQPHETQACPPRRDPRHPHRPRLHLQSQEGVNPAQDGSAGAMHGTEVKRQNQHGGIARYLSVCNVNSPCGHQL